MTSATDRMVGWPWNAFVGQRVVCVDASSRGMVGQMPEIREGESYTIRWIGDWWHPQAGNYVGFRLNEVVREDEDLPFLADRFRPLQTRDTSAEVEKLKRLTRGVRVEDEVRA